MDNGKTFQWVRFSAWLICIACVLPSIKTLAQEPVFRHYTTMNGLPSSETYSVIQDNKGYIWIATDRGLARFNGYEFKVFTSGQSGLRDNTIFGFHEDHRKRIWYHAYNGVIGYLYDDSFYTYPYNHIIRSSLKARTMEGISIDRNGSFMTVSIHYDSINLPLYINNKGRIIPVDTDSAFYYRDIYVSGNNTNVVAGNVNARHTRIISQETRQVLYTFRSQPYNDNIMSSFVCRKRNGDMLIYNAQEIFMIGPGGVKRIIRCKARVLNMMLDRHENLWVGYMNKGLDMYKAGDSTYTATGFLELSQNSISGMTSDKEGGLWFTTLENGVFYLPPDFIMSYGSKSGLPVPKVRIIENTNDKLIFIMSDHSIAYKYHDQKKIYALRGKQWQGFSDLVHTSSGKIYFANHRYGSAFATGWKRIPVQRIHIGKYNNWGYISAELYKQVNGRDSFIHFNHIGKITSICETGNDEILVGTLNGLYMYKAGKISPLKSFHPVFRQRISCIINLGSEHLAFATIGQGILVVRKNDFSNPQHYTVRNGLPSNMCNVLIIENDSTLIAGTNNGICRISGALHAASAKLYIADVNNGLISNEIYDIEVSGNDLWVGTANGLSILPLKILSAKENIIYLNMEEVRVGNRPVNKARRGLFQYDMNNMLFAFAGINFQHASKLTYKYRLAGSDDKWSFSSGRSVIYNALLPGDYTFEVYVIDADGKLRPGRISYSFSILPPFWKTWWFISLVCLLVAWLIYTLVARRIRKIRQQAQIQNDLNSFRDKALRSQMNPHFIYNSMNAIQNYIKKHETDASIDYLALFSRLMRTIFNNSGERAIPLEKDLEAVALYVEMENMRFSNRFRLHISYNDQVIPALIMVPPFLVQPFVENSILHGFRSKNEGGNIWIHIEKETERIKLSIRDDGVGREKTLETAKRKQAYLANEDRSSSGIKVTLKRISQVWGRKFSEDLFRITDLYTPDKHPAGTLIEFYLPLINYD